MRKEEGEEANVAAGLKDVLPVRNVEIHGVEISDHHGTVEGGDNEHEDREDEEGRLRGVEEVGMEDDEMEVVADEEELL